MTRHSIEDHQEEDSEPAEEELEDSPEAAESLTGAVVKEKEDNQT